MAKEIKEGFTDIFEELTWFMFRENGNPYIIEENVRKHNAQREMAQSQISGKDFR